MRNSQALRLLVAAAALAASSMAFAHARLLSSTPADKAEVAASPAKIELHFSEHLVPDFSAANLLMTAMPGMADHGPMKMAFTVTGAADGTTMVVTPTQPLPAGTYRLDWRAATTDTHTTHGSISFRVK